MFYIYQTTNGETELLYETTDEKVAQNEVERINSYLDSAGIPSWVSSAYYKTDQEEISNTEEFSDPCPECGKELEDAPGGGVKCSCGYWFCY
jgi:hypothetical protein